MLVMYFILIKNKGLERDRETGMMLALKTVNLVSVPSIQTVP